MSDLQSRAAAFVAGRKGTPHPERDDSAGTRYSDEQVVFHHEFTLGAATDVYPPGRHVIETSETSYAAGGHTAHVRQATLLIVPTVSGSCDGAQSWPGIKKDACSGFLNVSATWPRVSRLGKNLHSA